MSDRQRQESRRRLLVIPKQDDTPAGRSRAPAYADRVQTPTSSPERSDGGLLTLQSLVAFGVIAWALGIVLAVSAGASRLSQASAIVVLLLLGCVALLVGLGLLMRRVLPAATQVVVEGDISDPMTGLPTERYLLPRLEEEMARAQRNERPLTLAVLDVNGLAAVNEQYCRDCGDDVVRHVATVAQDTKRASDILARLEDDEFAIILPECNGEGAQAFVGRLTERLARQPVSTLVNNRPSHIWVGICVGLATMQPEEERPADLLARTRADLAASREERDRRRQQWRTA